MEDDLLTPCAAWQEKLAALHPADLLPAERAALDVHVACCPACAATLAEYVLARDFVRELFLDDRTVELPEWLTREDLAAKLPALPARGRYDNLPPRQGGLLGRRADLAYALEGLASFQPLLVIEGIGGVGKTTLAIEIAHQCLTGSDLQPIPLFDSVVWFSASAHLEQKRWLSELLNTIARVLDYPSVAQLRFEEKRARVHELLRAHATLVVIDNFDSICDPELPLWIQQIPISSKVLVTSRDMHGLQRAWTLHLKGLEGDDALELIRRHAHRLEFTAIARACPGDLLDLVRVTRGNPQAIAMVLGDMKNRGLNPGQALEGLSGAGDVLDHLFLRSWDALATNPGARHALLALPFFASSASREAIGAAAGLDSVRLETALERLKELSLIDASGEPGEAGTRYSIHPLTRAFTVARLRETREWEQEARERWVNWWLAFAREYGGRDGMEWARRYDRLEEEWENLLVVCEWCAAHDQYEVLRAFWSSERLLGMTGIYGYWRERIYWLRWLRQAAERRSDWATTIKAMAEQGLTLAQMGRIDEARAVLKQAWHRRHSGDPAAQVSLAENIVHWYIRTSDFAEAEHWLKKADHLLHGSRLSEIERARHRLTIKYYYGVIYLEKQDRGRAETYFKEVLTGTREIGWQRGTAYAQQFLADIARSRGLYNEAAELLTTGLCITERNKDRRRSAYYKRSFAYLALQRDRRSHLNEAIAWAQQALDDFERLGMPPEVGKLRRLLRRLKAAPRPRASEIPLLVEEVYSPDIF